MRTSECVEKTTATTTTLFDDGSGDKYDVEEEGRETDKSFCRSLSVAASNEALCTDPTRWRDRKKEEVERKVRVFVYSRFVI